MIFPKKLLISSGMLWLFGLLSPLTADWSLDGNDIRIVLPESPSATESFAAEELQTYVEKISGVKLPVGKGKVLEGEKVIIIGRHPANRDLWAGLDNPDLHVIDTAPEAIRIVGGYRPPISDAQGNRYFYEWGLLFGVYQFLEDQGIRWYRPEPAGEHVPKRKELQTTDGKQVYTPLFSLRWGFAIYATAANRSATDAQKEMAALWALRNRANTNIPLPDPKYGGSWRLGGGGHVHSSLVPPALFEKHPAFFAQIDGKRVPDRQLCYSNPALQDFFAEELIRRIGKNPQWRMTSIDPNDYGGFCECAECVAMDDPASPSQRGSGLSMSSRLYAFNNIIAEKVAGKYPDVGLYCLAYAQYMEPPTKVSKLSSNLIIGLAPFAGAYSDWSRTLRDPSSLPNSRFLKSIEGYSKFGVKLYGREYFSHYAWPGPLPMLGTMQDRFKEYRRYGFLGIYNETNPCWGPQGMDLYFCLRLLNNPDLDLEKELEAYCRNFYGPAAAPMLKYHRLIEERGTGGPYYGSGGSQAYSLFTRPFLLKLAPLVEEAARLAKGHEPYEWRTNAVLAGYEFARKYRTALEAIASGGIAEAKEALLDLETFYCDTYPEGDVFNKGEGRSRKNPDGTFRPPSFLRTLRASLAKSDSLASKFKNPKTVQMLNAEWRFKPDPEESGLAEGWHQQVDDREWASVESGQPWQHQGFSSFTGAAWYRRVFASPKIDAGERLMLVFMGADGDATIWLNGEVIGEHAFFDDQDNIQIEEPFFFDITDKLRRNEANQLTVRVKKSTGHGGLHREVKLVRITAE